jgi:hypothetical protein
MVSPEDIKAKNEQILHENYHTLEPTRAAHNSLKSTMATAHARKRSDSGSFDCVPGDWPKTAGPINVTFSVKRNKNLLKRLI